MEAFLRKLLPRLLHGETTFTIHAHQGKQDLLGKLGGRLRGYSKWLPRIARIVVLVDRDDENCERLKCRLEREAAAAGLLTRSSCRGRPWRVVNRIAVEELEAWFFGEWTSVRKAYPRASEAIPRHAAYREPDMIAGGTWEALERVLRKAGYFDGGIRKMEAAQAIGTHFDPSICSSQSFRVFWNTLFEA